MKLYVLDDNGKVIFEFSETSGGSPFSATASIEEKVKVVSLFEAAILFLANPNKLMKETK